LGESFGIASNLWGRILRDRTSVKHTKNKPYLSKGYILEGLTSRSCEWKTVCIQLLVGYMTSPWPKIYTAPNEH